MSDALAEAARSSRNAARNERRTLKQLRAGGASRIRPSPGIHDPEAAIRSLDSLRELSYRFPQLQVMVGHEPPRRR